MIAGYLFWKTDRASEVSCRSLGSVLDRAIRDARTSFGARDMDFVFEQFKLEILQRHSGQIEQQFVPLIVLENIQSGGESHRRGSFAASFGARTVVAW